MLGPNTFSMRSAMSAVREAFSFSKFDSVGRATSRAFAASVTVRPKGSSTSSRMISPGWQGFFMLITRSSMIVDQVDVGGVAVHEAEDQAPVSRDTDAPEAPQITGERMQPPARKRLHFLERRG